MNYGLYVITDRELSRGRDTLFVVEESLKGGAGTIQLRDKTMPTGELVSLGRKLKELTKKHNALLIVNDRVDVALAIDADGVHLGQDDMDIEDARRIMGDQYIIGLSVTNYEEFLIAKNSPADYLGAGPIFPTGSKADAAPDMGIEILKKISEQADVPVVAIGGISPDNAGSVIKAGADSISVISSVVSAPDIRKAAGLLAEQMKRGKE